MSVQGKKVTFDRTLEIIHIILELRSQIPSLIPMRILCGWLQHRKSVDNSGPDPILWLNNADIIRIIEYLHYWICEWGIRVSYWQLVKQLPSEHFVVLDFYG